MEVVAFQELQNTNTKQNNTKQNNTNTYKFKTK